MNFSFTKDQALLIDGKLHWIQRFNGRGQYHLDSADGELVALQHTELISLYTEGRLQGLGKGQTVALLENADCDPKLLPDISFFKKEHIEEALAKHECIQFILRCGPWNSSPDYLAPLIKEFCLTRGQGRLFGTTAIYEAHRKYQAAEVHWTAQLPRHFLKGNRTPRLDKDIRIIAKATFEEFYLSQQKPSIAATHKKIEEALRLQNPLASSYEELRVPSEAYVYRLRNNYSKFEITKCRQGHLHAQRDYPSGEPFETTNKTPRTT